MENFTRLDTFTSQYLGIVNILNWFIANTFSGENITVSNLYCHGSHGLSISVGFSNDSIALNTIQNVSFYNSILDGGRNGIHVKTHVDGGIGNITGVIYKNITMRGKTHLKMLAHRIQYLCFVISNAAITYNGILIQENYQNLPPSDTLSDVEPRNNIPIRNLVLQDVTGSVGSSATPVEIICADEGCFNWNWSEVHVSGENQNKCNFEPDGYSCFDHVLK